MLIVLVLLGLAVAADADCIRRQFEQAPSCVSMTFGDVDATPCSHRNDGSGVDGPPSDGFHAVNSCPNPVRLRVVINGDHRDELFTLDSGASKTWRSRHGGFSWLTAPAGKARNPQEFYPRWWTCCGQPGSDCHQGDLAPPSARGPR